jgi:hypothetical protein
LFAYGKIGVNSRRGVDPVITRKELREAWRGKAARGDRGNAASITERVVARGSGAARVAGKARRVAVRARKVGEQPPNVGANARRRTGRFTKN